MAEVRFLGFVRGYTQGDDDKIHLTIDDLSLSDSAKLRVHDMERSFDPSDPKHPYGANKIACNIRPGAAPYRIPLSPEMARGITQGTSVEVALDVFNVRKVKFSSKNRKWEGWSELFYNLISIKPVHGDGKSGQGDYNAPPTKPEAAGKSGK